MKTVHVSTREEFEAACRDLTVEGISLPREGLHWDVLRVDADRRGHPLLVTPDPLLDELGTFRDGGGNVGV